MRQWDITAKNEMKTLKFKWLPFFLCAGLCMALLSCEGNEPTNSLSNEENENGIKNEIGDGRLIIGKWHTVNSRNGVDLVFTFASNGEGCRNGDTFGYWSYTPETKLLATTLGDWSWNLNILTTHAMQGITTGNGRSNGFDRRTYVDENPKLIIGKWKDDNNTTECIFDGKNYTLTQDGATKKGTYIVNITKGSDITNNKATLTLDGTTYELENLQGGYISFSTKVGNNKIEYGLYYVK